MTGHDGATNVAEFESVSSPTPTSSPNRTNATNRALPLFATAEEIRTPSLLDLDDREDLDGRGQLDDLDELDELDELERLDGLEARGATAAEVPPGAPATAAGDGPPAAGGGAHVVRGSIWYIAAVGTGAAFSFLFWFLAAKVAPQDVVGTGTALFIVLNFVNFVTGMGLPVAVARFGSLRRSKVHVLFFWALFYTTIASLVGTLTFGLASGAFVRNQSVLDALWQWGTPAGLLIFFLLTTGISFALLVEVRLVTMREWKWVFARVLVISVVRIPLLFIPALGHTAMGELLLIAGPPAVSGFVGAWVLFRATPRRHRGHLLKLPVETTAAFRYASANYPGMLAAQAPQFTLPLLVAGNITADEFAPFYFAWSITVVVFLVPHTIGQVVLAEGSKSHAARAQQFRHGMKLSLGLMVVAAIGAFVGAGLVALAFPAGYKQIAVLLPRFVAAGIPWAITCMCLAKARVEANHIRTVSITLAFAIFTLGPAAIMSARSGSEGAATAWLIGNVVAAVFAAAMTWSRGTRVQSGAQDHLVPFAARADH